MYPHKKHARQYVCSLSITVGDSFLVLQLYVLCIKFVYLSCTDCAELHILMLWTFQELSVSFTECQFR